jgi:hypothetical protein
MFVRPQYRGLGPGRLMVNHVAEFAIGIEGTKQVRTIKEQPYRPHCGR